MFRPHFRIIAAITLGFFTWTSGGLFSIASAAQLEAKKHKARAGQQKTDSPEDRFSKIAEDPENTLADIKTDISSTKARLKASHLEEKITLNDSLGWLRSDGGVE